MISRQLLVRLLVLLGLLMPVVGPAVDVGTASEPAAAGLVGAATSRIAGADRYATAVAISRYRFSDPAAARSVYLARGDSLMAAVVAGTLSDGPVLLVRPGCAAVPSVVAAEVRRLDPDVVIALGGVESVCDATLAAAAQGRPAARVGTSSSIETAAQIAVRAFPAGASTVYLTRNSVTPDAVSAGMLRDGPVLLVSSDGTVAPVRTRQAITELGATRVVALGGPVAVSDAALAQAASGRTSGRLAGADRYATSIAIAKHAYPARTGRVYLTRGNGATFADAAASGVLVDGPVVLTPGPCEPVRASTAAYLRQRSPSRVVALGGTAVLCDSTLRGASLAARPTIDCAAVRCVALTFDDGPSPYTPALLDTLAGNRIPATFFEVGQMIDLRGATSRRAHVEGNQVANHAWDHRDLTTLTRAQQQWEVDITDAELNQHGVPDAKLLRPPYGAFNSSTRQLGVPLVLWDVDPRDWDGPPSSATVRARVVSAVRPGSIVLMHDLYNSTVNAVPGIVADLKAAGYTFVTVSELVPTARPGDVIYSRTRVTRSGTAADAEESTVLDDGSRPGVLRDDAPAPRGVEQKEVGDRAIAPVE